MHKKTAKAAGFREVKMVDVKMGELMEGRIYGKDEFEPEVEEDLKQIRADMVHLQWPMTRDTLY